MRASISRAAGYFADEAYDPRLVLLLGLLSLTYVAVQVVQIFEYVMPAGQFKIVHVGGAALLICLYAAGSAKSLASRWVHFALAAVARSEEHTSELQSLMRISYAVFCLKQKN